MADSANLELVPHRKDAAADPADLELILRRRDAACYVVDLIFRQSDSEADVRPLGDQAVTVILDPARLLAETLDPAAYGRTITGMLFANRRAARPGLAHPGVVWRRTTRSLYRAK